jgi:hypothetical protein
MVFLTAERLTGVQVLGSRHITESMKKSQMKVQRNWRRAGWPRNAIRTNDRIEKCIQLVHKRREQEYEM